MNKQGALTSQSDRPRNISIPLPNGSVFAFLRKMRTIDGAVGVITSTSLTEMGGGALLLGRVNSPERRKPKKATQAAAHSNRASNSSSSPELHA